MIGHVNGCPCNRRWMFGCWLSSRPNNPLVVNVDALDRHDCIRHWTSALVDYYIYRVTSFVCFAERLVEGYIEFSQHVTAYQVRSYFRQVESGENVHFSHLQPASCHAERCKQFCRAFTAAASEIYEYP